MKYITLSVPIIMGIFLSPNMIKQKRLKRYNPLLQELIPYNQQIRAIEIEKLQLVLPIQFDEFIETNSDSTKSIIPYSFLNEKIIDTNEQLYLEQQSRDQEVFKQQKDRINKIQRSVK